MVVLLLCVALLPPLRVPVLRVMVVLLLCARADVARDGGAVVARGAAPPLARAGVARDGGAVVVRGAAPPLARAALLLPLSRPCLCRFLFSPHPSPFLSSSHARGALLVVAEAVAPAACAVALSFCL